MSIRVYGRRNANFFWKNCVWKKRMWKFQQVNCRSTKLLFVLYVCTGTVQPLVSQDWQWIWLRVSSIAKSRKNGCAYKCNLVVWFLNLMAWIRGSHLEKIGSKVVSAHLQGDGVSSGFALGQWRLRGTCNLSQSGPKLRSGDWVRPKQHWSHQVRTLIPL